MTTIRFVDVKSGVEVATATADGADVTYDGGDVAKAVVERRAQDSQLAAGAAVRRLAVEGWSNGYLMIALPGPADEDEAGPLVETIAVSAEPVSLVETGQFHTP